MSRNINTKVPGTITITYILALAHIDARHRSRYQRI